MFENNLSDCYFMRRMTLSDDEYDEEAEPIFIKIPVSLLAPSMDQCILLGVLSGYYAVDAYILIDSIEENYLDQSQVTIIPFGVVTNITLLITSEFEDGVEAITGIITPYGEFALGFFDGNQMISPIMDDYLAEELGLKASMEVQAAHNDFLKSIECDDCEEKVYIPNALYV